jgi:hypothetical protein
VKKTIASCRQNDIISMYHKFNIGGIDMEQIKNDLKRALSKQELIDALEESYEALETMHDDNLDRMAQLHEQLRAIDENNTSLRLKMKDIANKIHGLKTND